MSKNNCLHCGAIVSKKDKFCETCGLELPKGKKEEQKLRKEKIKEIHESEKYRKKVKKRILIYFLIILISLGVIFIPTKRVPYQVEVPYTTQESYQTTEAYQTTEPYQTQEAYTDYEKKTFTEEVQESDCDKKTGCSCNGYAWFGLGACNQCNCEVIRDVPVTKYRTVTKYQTVTKYRPVTKYQTVTRTKMETRYRMVNWIFGECFYNCGS